MVIIEDTRNQKDKHKNINTYLLKCGHEVIRSKMLVGDYQLSGDGKICIDTKQDVIELIMDFHQEHKRFKAECELAKKCGITLIILVEEKLPEGGLVNWKSPLKRDGKPYTTTNPATLRKAMITMQERYGVRFLFCDKRSTGKKIIEILSGSKK